MIAASWVTTAAASTEAAADPVVAERLQCLQRPKKPEFPTEHPHDRRHGLMRFKLSFEPTVGKPKVEVLHASVVAELQELAFEYVEGFRLPCLQPGDPRVSIVQEVAFSGAQDAEPLPLIDQAGQQSCVVMPREGIKYMSSLQTSGESVIAYVRFTGDAQSEPKIHFGYSSGNPHFEEAVREHLTKYRMPCRSAGDPPFFLEQEFRLRVPGDRPFVLTRTDFSLRELIGFTEEPQKLKADFDLDTMACPFKVALAMRQPKLRNLVKEIGPANANRIALLRWLSELRFSWQSEKQAQDLFNSRVTVTVPCGTVKLNPPPSPQGVSS